MEINTTISVASAVRAELVRQGISGSALGRSLGWSQGAVSRRLRGVIPFDLNELDAVASFLKVPLSALMLDADDPDNVKQPA